MGDDYDTWLENNRQVEAIKITIAVIQGDQLVAKDRNVMGQWTTSDPFVSVSLFPTGPDGPKIKLGQSETIRYTLTPKWDFETSLEIALDDVTDDCQFCVTIVDWDDDMTDEDAEDNLMGVVPCNVTPSMYKNLPLTTRTRWYGVPATSADRASGRIQCKIDVSKRRICLGDIVAPVFKKPSGVPILDQATYKQSDTEKEFSKSVREVERQGGNSVMTDLQVLRLSARATASSTTLGRMTLGAAEMVKDTALGGANGVRNVAVGGTNFATQAAIGSVTGVVNVASYGVGGAAQVAAGSINMATQVTTGGVNMAVGSVNMAAQVATGSVNMAAQVATGSVNMVGQTMKSTAGMMVAPLSMFSSNNNSKKKTDEAGKLRHSTGRGQHKKALSSRNLFSSMPFTEKHERRGRNGMMKRAASSTGLGIFSKSPTGNQPGEEEIAPFSTRPADKTGPKPTAAMQLLVQPLAPAEISSKKSAEPSQEQQQPKPDTPTIGAKVSTGEKEQRRLDMTKVEKLEAAKPQPKGGGPRPKPVRQRSVPRIRKSNSQKQLQQPDDGNAKTMPGIPNKKIESLTQRENIDDFENSKIEKKRLKKMKSMLSQSTTADGISKVETVEEKKERKAAKKKLKKSQSMVVPQSSDANKKRSPMEHTPKRGSMEHSPHSQISSCTNPSHEQEIAMMRRSLKEQDARVKQLELEMAELRLLMNKRGSMGHFNNQGASNEHESHRRGSTGCVSCGSLTSNMTDVTGDEEELRETSKNAKTAAPAEESQSQEQKEDEAGFYVDPEGVTYYLDKEGVEYYQGADGGWYSGGMPEAEKATATATATRIDEAAAAGWFLDTDGTKYYVDKAGSEFYRDSDGKYYNDDGRLLSL